MLESPGVIERQDSQHYYKKQPVPGNKAEINTLAAIVFSVSAIASATSIKVFASAAVISADNRDRSRVNLSTRISESMSAALESASSALIRVVSSSC